MVGWPLGSRGSIEEGGYKGQCRCIVIGERQRAERDDLRRRRNPGECSHLD